MERYGRVEPRGGHRRARIAVAICFLVAASACGSKTISVTGTVSEQGTCLSLVLLAGGTPLDDLQMTFKDGSGAVIGTTQTGKASLDEQPPYTQDEPCTVSAAYSLGLPKADFYQVEIEGVGQQPAPIPYSTLEGDDFRYDIQLSTS